LKVYFQKYFEGFLLWEMTIHRTPLKIINK